MNSLFKQCAAVALNLALLTSQMSAELQQITFDSAEWIPYQSVGQTAGTGWNLVTGSASVSAQGAGYGGGNALNIPANALGETRLTREIAWNAAETTAFIDLRIKPAANPENSLSNIVTNGTQLAFQVPQGSNVGEIWVYQGSDGTRPAEWIRTAGTFNVPAGATNADGYVRLTLRHDYSRKLWDLFIDDKLAAANLSFETNIIGNLQSIDFFGSEAGDTHIDDIAALKDNMLFPDADKDGLPDAWEIANGSNPNDYDRNDIKLGTGKSFLDTYMDSLWLNVSGRGGALVSSGGTIPALELPAQVAVGALKGSLSVGSDGAANYSIPIDIPKGTAGMEPKLSLSYSSNAGNGQLGVGWSLSGLQRITRGPSTVVKDGVYDPVDFDENDRFFLDGQRLIRVPGNGPAYGAPDSEYRTENDSYARIIAKGSGGKIVWWTVETKAGLKLIFGGGDSSVSVNGNTLAWCVNEVSDTKGNYYSVDYVGTASPDNKFDMVDHRVSAINYTGNGSMDPYCHIFFDYETRHDPSRSYSNWMGVQNTRRLSKIRVLTGSFVNHSYRLTYGNSFQSGRSLLKSVAKHANDLDSLSIPPTTFAYDGLQPLPDGSSESSPIWEDPSSTSLPRFSSGLDATGEVNSMVTVNAAKTSIRLTGDVARAYTLPKPGVNIYSNSRIRFDLNAYELKSGALIGLDTDNIYQDAGSTLLYRIGGTGTIKLADGLNFTGTRVDYDPPNTLKTFDLPIGTLGTGLKTSLILMCVDNQSSDGEDSVTFSNVKIYRSGENHANVSPIEFNVDTELPRLTDDDGNDMGIVPTDLNSDSLLDFADWRAIDYTVDLDNNVVPKFKGAIYMNTGSEADSRFVQSLTFRPDALPLSTQRDYPTAHAINTANHVTAQPTDIDGDGILDLLVSTNMKFTDAGAFKNTYDFYAHNGTDWVAKPGWNLPFTISTVDGKSTQTRRDDYFQWADMNADGYQDLVVRTNGWGKLLNRSTGSLMAGTNASVVFLNKGKAGPGWVMDTTRALPAPLLENGKDVGRRLLDLNGDGMPELIKSRFEGGGTVREVHRMKSSGSYLWTPNSTIGSLTDPYELPFNLLFSNGNPTPALLMDVNGDGLVDAVQSTFDHGAFDFRTWLNTGERSAAPWQLESDVSQNSYKTPMPLHYDRGSSDTSSSSPYGFEAADINGDGLVDILYSDEENAATSGSDDLVLMNTGNGWDKRLSWGIPGNTGIFANSTERDNSKRRAKLMDVTGDGFPDLITGLIYSSPKVWKNKCKPEVLISVTDGFGSELGINYRRLNDATPVAGFNKRVYEKFTGTLPYGQASIIDSRLVVSTYTEPDGNGGRRSRSQRYGDLRYDRNNETSLGFGWIEALDNRNGQLSRTDTRRDYPYAGSPDTVETSVYVDATDLSSALPSVTVGNKSLTFEKYHYGELPSSPGIGGTIRRPVQTGSEVTRYDLLGNIVGKTIISQTFDYFGFVATSTAQSLDGSTVTTSNTYDHHTTNGRWQLGRLKNSTVTKSGGSKPALARTSAFTYDASGLLETETIEPNQTAFKSTKTYGRDRFGNITSTTLTAGLVTRSSTAGYDPSGRFLTSETNALNHSVTYQYDTARALLSSTTDANDHITRFYYDEFGTLTLTQLPDGTQTGERTGFATNDSVPISVKGQLTGSIRYFRAKQSSGTPIAKVYLDALGRELVTETTILRDAQDSGSSRYKKVYSVTRYDALDRKSAVSQSFFDGETPGYTNIKYDLLNRVLSTTHPDDSKDFLIYTKTVTLNAQPHTWSRSTNRGGMQLERWEDQHGRMVQSMDSSGLVTTFTHDQDGRLKTATVGGVKLLENTFDILGNKTDVWEANSGTSSSQYNALGEVTSTTNANSQTTTFTYDTLGRPKTTTRPEGVTYTVDYDPAGNKGKPWRTTGTDGTEDTVQYDSYGRPISTTTTRPSSGTFGTSTSYDALGRVHSSKDAGGLVVVTEYDSKYSFPVHMRIGPGSPGAGSGLWTAGSFDSQGHGHNETLAHGVTRDAVYDSKTGLSESLQATREGSLIQDYDPTWDSRGNLRSRKNNLTGRLEVFNYDHINRVDDATVTSTNSGDPVPAYADYTYATNGNLLTKPGASLTYAGPRPHAVTSATLKGVNHTYTYDAAGYLTHDTVGGNARRTLAWTSFGQLAALDYKGAPALQNFSGGLIFAASDVETNFQFDSGGNRSRQLKTRIALGGSRQLEETLYLGSYEREIHTTKTTPTATPDLVKTVHRHSIGGFAAYIRTETVGIAGSAVRLSLILKDHLGSTDLILTGSWNGSAFSNIQTERQSFDAWGERRSAETFVTYRAADTDSFRTSAQDYDRGYTGHEQLDDSGLIHMNGRLYDPELGRMLSPDPYVQVPEYSQNFNRYSYVLNNPLNLTDPTGYSWLGDVFHAVGTWIKENWRTIVVIVVVVVLSFFTAGIGSALLGPTLAGTATGISVGTATVTYGAIAGGAAIGAVAGGLSAALAGGDLGDVLRGAVIGGISGALTGALHGVGGTYGADAANIAGHGVVGGASNVAMGGKFQDGFLSASASAATSVSGLTNPETSSLNFAGRTAVASVAGGTASALGGGKFANGAYTGAFQHLLNAELRNPNGGWSDDPPRAIPLDRQVMVFDPSGTVGYGSYEQPITGGTLYWLDVGGEILETFNVRTGGLVIDPSKPAGSDTQVRNGVYRVTNWQSSRPGKPSFTDFDRKLSYSLDVDPSNWGSRKIWQSLIRFHPDGPIRNGVCTQPGTAGCLGVTNVANSHVRFYDRATDYFSKNNSINLHVLRR